MGRDVIYLHPPRARLYGMIKLSVVAVDKDKQTKSKRFAAFVGKTERELLVAGDQTLQPN